MTESAGTDIVKLGSPVVDDLIVKVATPDASVVAGDVTIVSVAPRLEVKVTDFPDSATPDEFLIVTEIVEVDEPLATKETGAIDHKQFAAFVT